MKKKYVLLHLSWNTLYIQGELPLMEQTEIPKWLEALRTYFVEDQQFLCLNDVLMLPKHTVYL